MTTTPRAGIAGTYPRSALASTGTLVRRDAVTRGNRKVIRLRVGAREAPPRVRTRDTRALTLIGAKRSQRLSPIGGAT